ncbi:hypothetical protein [Anaerostipes sp.]|uniref:hypothetical protein n=1 Tax=Anaerostipes sp. TaxID=1872530 RepID=UPI0025C3C915|nr:hypothetical protein [Anaerostipes sp.]MBS7009110.1 hypothetical protein [Anaerostipes sp.]
MQIISELIKYHWRQYLKTNKFVMPFAALIIMLFTLYSSKPVEVTDSFISSCQFVFLIASWIGISLTGLEDPVSEQIIILRIKSHKNYYIIHTLFLLSISAATSVICTAVPVLINLLNDGQLFSRPLLVSDIITGFYLLFLSVFLGCTLGELSHPRIIRDRKSALLLILFIDIVSFIKTALITGFPVLKFILWIVPPISLLPSVFSNHRYFLLPAVAAVSAVLILYSCVLALVKIQLLTKKKF